jgi:hypothetical protein
MINLLDDEASIYIACYDSTIWSHFNNALRRLNLARPASRRQLDPAEVLEYRSETLRNSIVQRCHQAPCCRPAADRLLRSEAIHG